MAAQGLRMAPPSSSFLSSFLLSLLPLQLLLLWAEWLEKKDQQRGRGRSWQAGSELSMQMLASTSLPQLRSLNSTLEIASRSLCHIISQQTLLGVGGKLFSGPKLGSVGYTD